ncbi:MAG TPA: hypothetical protein VJX66_02180 [Amycolatopsis sp.]|nr:hypothetical protein [Amycolatopsis sp.]
MDEEYLRQLCAWLRDDPGARDSFEEAWAACVRFPDVVIPAPRTSAENRSRFPGGT